MPKLSNKSNNEFSINADINNTEWLNVFFNIPLNISKTMHVDLGISDKKKTINLSCQMPDFVYKEKAYKNGAISISNPNDTLSTKIIIDKITDKDNRMNIKIYANAINDKIISDIKWNSNGDMRFFGTLNTETRFIKNERNESAAKINVQESEIMVGDSKWKIQPSSIIYSNNNIEIDKFAIEHNKQHIYISGKATNNYNDSVIIDIQDIEVEYILNILNFHAVEFSGFASGRINIASVFKNPSAKANITVDDFHFQHGRMGTLFADVNWNRLEKQIDINATANDEDNRKTIIKGYVSPERNFIDLDINASNTRLEFLESFCSSFMRNVNANGNGNVKL